MCLLLSRFLKRQGYEVATASSGTEAVTWLKTNEPLLVLCDFRLGDITGTELLRKIKEHYAKTPVIIVTGYSDVKEAVEVMKIGAYDYVTKPLLPDEILVTIRKALAEPSVGSVKLPLASEAKTAPASASNAKKAKNGSVPLAWDSDQYIIGKSEAFANIIRQIQLVAPTNYSVIIYGESGSGKEVIAQQIHKNSKRADKPFVAIDCGALTKDLAGSELFGHEKGAFTGALNQKIGSFQLANGGTIFLDEIANLSYEIQVSLLRVVQERKMRRVGGTKDIELDLRIIVASNEHLWTAAQQGRFREDLYHRFNEFSMEVPPLRERKGDIMLFANHFLARTNAELEKQVKGFSKEVEEIFLSYPWYGNLRELKNVIKRATLLTDGALIEAKSLPFEIAHFGKLQFERPPFPIDEERDAEEEVADRHYDHNLKTANLDAEFEVINKALKKANYNKSKAAKLLNIDRKTLYNKMKQFQAFKEEL